MEQQPPGENPGDTQQQPEIILSPAPSPAAPSPAPAASRICPNCGTANPPDSVYCHKCGVKLPDIAFQNKKICAGCGAANEPTSQFCYKCGLQLPDKLGGGYAIRYAGFWVRLLAIFIDGILLGVVISIVVGVIAAVILGSKLNSDWLSSFETSGKFDSTFWIIYLIYIVCVYAVQTIYYTVAIGKWGKTIGKAALKLKVVKPDGSRVSYWRAFGRSLAYQLNGFTMGLSFLIIAFTSKKRGLHDYIADTIVIKTD
jgi:uncharacterized RDD family membrane protein YckC/ribosomal protein L40E